MKETFIIYVIDMLQKFMTLCNKNSVNGYGEDVSMLSLEKPNADMLDGTK